MDYNYILHKYLNGEANAEEIRLLKDSPAYAAMVKIADVSTDFEVPAYDADKNLERILYKVGTQKESRNVWIPRTLKIAALLLVLLASYIFIQNLDTKIATQIAQQEVIVLPSHSEVHLNSNSTLSYNSNRWQDAREISLKGEAYFKVTKGSTFEVTTSEGIITVLGTEFNVYSRNGILHVACFEGLVEVAFKNEKKLVPAGKKIQIENGIIMLDGSTQNVSPRWIFKESSFTDVSLATVLQELQNQYDVEVNYGEELDARRFSGSFTHKDLDTALKSICTPLGLQYAKKGTQVTIYDEGSK